MVFECNDSLTFRLEKSKKPATITRIIKIALLRGASSKNCRTYLKVPFRKAKLQCLPGELGIITIIVV